MLHFFLINFSILISAEVGKFVVVFWITLRYTQSHSVTTKVLYVNFLCALHFVLGEKFCLVGANSVFLLLLVVFFSVWFYTCQCCTPCIALERQCITKATDWGSLRTGHTAQTDHCGLSGLWYLECGLSGLWYLELVVISKIGQPHINNKTFCQKYLGLMASTQSIEFMQTC